MHAVAMIIDCMADACERSGIARKCYTTRLRICNLNTGKTLLILHTICTLAMLYFVLQKFVNKNKFIAHVHVQAMLQCTDAECLKDCAFKFS